MKKLHLICNAHLDPIWLWDWEEGAATAISTFRSAADLADTFDFIFCHNEVILYKWIQEYEPALFKRIKQHVEAGKWHIMGGWYLQPDCNMPSGESIIRQAMCGKKYFKDNFDAYPKTAINVDPFGHSIGLVQILKKCGYDSYLFCRPFPCELNIEDTFIWKGLDDSEIKCFRASAGYNSPLGNATQKITDYINKNQETEIGMLLWGVGNHGGGPSKKDLIDILTLMQDNETEIIHSTPEAYFSNANNFNTVFSHSLYPSMVGCYSSQIKIKQKHRLLENQYYMVEKMCSIANIFGLMEYPDLNLEEAQNDLLNAQFHDILPGSSIKEGETSGLRLMEHGLEIISRIRAKVFFALCSGQEKTKSGEYSILVYNPHPYTIKHTVECEFQLEDQNWGDDFTTVTAYSGEQKLPTQVIKESANLNLDWRKKIIFDCVLMPTSMNRFDCRVSKIAEKPTNPKIDNVFIFNNGNLSVTVNKQSGLIDSMQINGNEYLLHDAFLPVVIEDTEDPWASSLQQNISLGEKVSEFKLMKNEEASRYIGQTTVIPSVRIIEDGEVTTIVEAVFSYNYSCIIVNYIFYKNHNEFEVKYTVFWNEKSKALKLKIPTTITGSYIGEVVFGLEELPNDGHEVCMQKWCMIEDKTEAFAIINDCTYASSCIQNEIYLTLLRSPSYAALPINDRKIIPNDRYIPHIDQGEHHFSFRILADKSDEIQKTINYKSQVFNEAPFALNVFPSGEGESTSSFIELTDKTIQLVALKKCSDSAFIIRLFNNTSNPITTIINIPYFNIKSELKFNKFEVKTLKLENNILKECELMEI